LGIGPFIVRQALGILGHRIDVASIPCRGSRFSIFVARETKRKRRRASDARGGSATRGGSHERFRGNHSRGTGSSFA
jgi:hypothetical protein